MKFAELIGQQEIAARLGGALREGRIPHALMLAGPEGSGNLALALALVQNAFCKNRDDFDACGECPACRKVSNLQHADLHFSFPITIEKDKREESDHMLPKWREQVLQDPYFTLEHWTVLLEAENKQLIIPEREASAISRKLVLTSYEGGLKFMILWRPELLRPEAANKLLKIIEEPPDKTIFILVSCSPQNILPTILSRVQLIKIPAIPADLITDRLVEEFSLGQEEAGSIAILSNGNLFQARQMVINRDEAGPTFDRFVEWMRNCYAGETLRLIPWVEEFAKSGREEQKAFLVYTLHFFRQCISGNYSGGELALLAKKEAEFSTKFAPFINHLNILELTESVEVAHRDIARNVSAKIVFTDLSFQIHKLLRRKG
jgi:DNA polymerase-3 subunit delta'